MNLHFTRQSRAKQKQKPCFFQGHQNTKIGMPSDGSNWAQALGTPQAARSYSSQQRKKQQHSNRPAGGWGLHISRGSHSHVHALVEKLPRPAQRPRLRCSLHRILSLFFRRPSPCVLEGPQHNGTLEKRRWFFTHFRQRCRNLLGRCPEK